jgi:hypothetical protein
MMFNRLILLCRKPSYSPFSFRIFTPYTLAPRKFIVDLDEVVVPENGGLGLYPAEEVGHWFFQFFLEAMVLSAHMLD